MLGSGPESNPRGGVARDPWSGRASSRPAPVVIVGAMADPYAGAKRSAGRAAADLVPSGARLGLGTGSTFVHVLDRLHERMRDGFEVVGVPTSEATALRARELEIPLCDLAEVEFLDLAIDGADEVDPDLHLIKGAGGALVREKIVAAAARELIVVVSSNKVVEHLGAHPLPVEVMRFGWQQTGRALERLGCQASLRRQDDDEPYSTDNANYVFDCAFGSIENPTEMEARINAIPGVLDNGLFVGMATKVIVAEDNGEIRTLG